MYLAVFAVQGTTELAEELLIEASSEDVARQFADGHAIYWGFEVFSLAPATTGQIRTYQLMGKAVRAGTASSQEQITEKQS